MGAYSHSEAVRTPRGRAVRMRRTDEAQSRESTHAKSYPESATDAACTTRGRVPARRGAHAAGNCDSQSSLSHPAGASGRSSGRAAGAGGRGGGRISARRDDDASGEVETLESRLPSAPLWLSPQHTPGGRTEYSAT